MKAYKWICDVAFVETRSGRKTAVHSRPARQSRSLQREPQRGRTMGTAIGLVMTGGGARGAYQAGVLKRIGEIKRVQTQGNPFPIIEGASAGAINGAALAAGSDDFALVTKVTAQLWSELSPSDIFRCDVFSQARNSLTWMLDLSFGAVLGGGNAHSLLDATPLRHFLSTHFNCDRIQENIKRGHLYALAISATNYNSGKSYLFIQRFRRWLSPFISRMWTVGEPIQQHAGQVLLTFWL